jgi:hypothetical protein
VDAHVLPLAGDRAGETRPAGGQATALARRAETGFPDPPGAVVDVGDATRRVEDGGWPTVDGSAGTVEIDHATGG